MFHFTPPQTNRCKSVSTKGWSYFRMATTEAVTFFRLRGTRRKILKNDTSSGLAPDKNFFFFSCLCPFILLPDPPPHIMDQNTHLGSLLVPATFLGLGGPSPVKLICERGAFHLVKMTKSKAPRLHTFVIVQVRRRGLCGFLLAETTQNGSLKCSSSTRGG